MQDIKEEPKTPFHLLTMMMMMMMTMVGSGVRHSEGVVCACPVLSPDTTTTTTTTTMMMMMVMMMMMTSYL